VQSEIFGHESYSLHSPKQMRNIALLIGYDGAAYSGWQVQKNAVSVQGVIESKLSGLLQEKIKVIGAGRTDAGVHAYGQVANFHSDSNWDLAEIVYSLNCILPPDIAIRNAADVPDEFHSRFDAIARRYTYRIIAQKSPMVRHFVALFHYDLSIDLMNEASAFLVGMRSFKSFTKYADEQRSFVCSVVKASWETEAGRNSETAKMKESPNPRFPGFPILRFEIEADRFLHGMVRAIVGTLIDVGRRKISVENFKGILNSEDRTMAAMSAPECGLCLEEVRYGFEIWRTDAHRR